MRDYVNKRNIAGSVKKQVREVVGKSERECKNRYCNRASKSDWVRVTRSDWQERSETVYFKLWEKVCEREITRGFETDEEMRESTSECWYVGVRW